MQQQGGLFIKAPTKEEAEAGFRVPEPDIYEMVLVGGGVEDFPTRQASFNGEVKPDKFQVRLTFSIVGGEFDGVTFRQWFGFSLHPKADLRKLVDAILGEPLGDGEGIDLLTLRQRRFRGVVEVNERPDRDDPRIMRRWAKLTKAMPSKRNEAKAAARAGRPAYDAAAPVAPAAMSPEDAGLLARAEAEARPAAPAEPNPFDVDDY